MNNDDIVKRITQYLKKAYGANAKFKKDQCESIVSVINKTLTLVVQKTGWGKSLVYFIATRYFRELGYGPTIIVSPLLSLMRNQQDAAEKFGIKCISLNCDNNVEKNPEIRNMIANDLVDIIFTTPEHLNKPNIRKLLINNIKKELALLVVDEAHCISEWGHDFRPDYAQIKSFISDSLNNPKLHILATTATANNVVINDLMEQFASVGADMNVIRGELIRDSLYIEIIKGMSIEQKFAWIRSFLKVNKGAGIIYSLTIRDANILAKYLRHHNIEAVSYHSKIENRVQIESDFFNNTIQVLVATSALGMGYDKPDISFVIHLQPPLKMLEYYQQIGRAGRGIDKANIYLMYGPSDDKIAEYFIENSFPDPEIMKKILNYFDDHSFLKISELLKVFNLKKHVLESILKHLISRGLLTKTDSYYERTLKKSNLDEYIKEKNSIIDLNRLQYVKMKEFIDYEGCLMSFISNELDDPFVRKCGKCAYCTNTKTDIVPAETDVKEALDFINHPYIFDRNFNLIKHREKLPSNKGLFSQCGFVNNDGYFLTKYLVGLGENVRNDKYQKGEFSSLLVHSLRDMIRFLVKEQAVVSDNVVITYIPSLKRPTLVKNLAERVAKELNLPCVETLVKIKDNKEQKTMLNSVQQFMNVSSAFGVYKSCIDKIQNKNIYLIDDMVDSRWTFTCCGIVLYKGAHVKSVTPFALADTSSE